MISRVFRVCAFMVMRLLDYSARRLFRVPGLDRVLVRDYLGWADYVVRVFQADVKVEGREHIPPAGDGRKLVVMCNHQSQLDIPVLVSSLQRKMGFVAKRELGRIPLLNFWMRQVGCVFIDRSDRTGAHRALEKVAQEMGADPLVVFPEGTRSKDGRLLPLKLGGCRLAVMAGAQVLPVLIQGTRDAAENRGSRHGHVPVTVRIFPRLDAGGLPDAKASHLRIKEYLERCWQTQRGPEAPAPEAAAAG